ncbi:MAG: hypothetical protein QG595_1080 [Pseudomonadota bacterium]|nr:hypothetical protein [Pseudomonadota bacterium]
MQGLGGLSTVLDVKVAATLGHWYRVQIANFAAEGYTRETMIRAIQRKVSILLLLGATASSAVAAGPIESRPIEFANGASSATISASLKGEQTIDYKLRARAGQRMSVKLKSSNAANYFNVLPPGSQDVAIFVGSSDGNEWSGSLETDGEYTVRVYLMRSAARRNETASYTLTVGIAGFGG